MHLKQVSVFALLLLASCMPRTEQKIVQNGPSKYGGNSERPIRWHNSKLSSPLDVEISQSLQGIVDDDGQNPFILAMKSWNEAHSNIDFFDLQPNYVSNKDNIPLSSFRDTVMGIYRSDSWNYGQGSDTLAITQYFGYIQNIGLPNEYLELTHADIMLNYRDNDFSTSSEPEAYKYDLQSVVVHELGHLLGQKHQYDFAVESVMQPYLDDGESNRILSNYDKQTLQNSYAGYIAGLHPIYAAGPDRDQREGEEISGVFELRKDGRCYHWQDGKLVHVHTSHHFKP